MNKKAIQIKALPVEYITKLKKYLSTNRKGITTYAGFIVSDPRLKDM